MSDRARVTSIQALKDFRPSVIQFAEETQAALMATHNGATRVLGWLTREQGPRWTRQVRRAEEEVVRARTRMISRAAGPGGSPQPRTDDRMEFERAKRNLAHARERLDNVRRHARNLQKAIEDYRARVAPIAWFVRADLAQAVGGLDRMTEALEAYTKVAPRPGGASGPDSEAGGAGPDAERARGPDEGEGAP